MLSDERADAINYDHTAFDGLTALHMACIDGLEIIVQLLAEKGDAVNFKRRDGIQNYTPLLLATDNGNAKCVAELLKVDCGVDEVIIETNETALMLAAKVRYFDTIFNNIRRIAQILYDYFWNMPIQKSWTSMERLH